MSSKKKTRELEVKKPKRKISRWFFAGKYYEDQEEEERLKDVDYRHWKLNNF